jgi:citrate lyase subunit beta/citryl-CoA lyase
MRGLCNPDCGILEGMTRRPRSVLYVPASRGKFLEKIPSLTADLVLVDLEDGVAPDDKDAAREHVRAAVASGVLGGDRAWMMRVNGGRSGIKPEDLTLVGFAKPTIVVLPKAEDPEFVRTLASRFADHGAATALMIETAAGVASAMELMGAHASVCMAIVGSADLQISLGARPEAGRLFELHALSQVLLAARRFGRTAIDSVYFRYRDDAGLRAHAAIARELGYDGKSCIHPSQVPTIHELYGSTPEEIRWARRVVAAWEDGQGAANGVVAMDGEMIEALHVSLAERILERSEGRAP